MSGMSWVLIYTVFYVNAVATGHVYFAEGIACTQALKALEDGNRKIHPIDLTGFCVRTSLSGGP